jgi:hypothetical protein
VQYRQVPTGRGSLCVKSYSQPPASRTPAWPSPGPQLASPLPHRSELGGTRRQPDGGVEGEGGAVVPHLLGERCQPRIHPPMVAGLTGQTPVS